MTRFAGEFRMRLQEGRHWNRRPDSSPNKTIVRDEKPPGVEGGCRDRIDNDGDGLLDCDDPDCNGKTTCSGACRDGEIQLGLQGECDDGDILDGDGCISSCQIE